MPRIPRFRNDKEAAEFWETHDVTEFLDELEETEEKVSPELRRKVVERAELKKPVTLRLEPRQVEKAKEIARKKSVPYQTLLRMWIAEGIAKEKVG